MKTTKKLKKRYGSIVVPKQQTMAQWLEHYEGERAAQQAEWRKTHGPFQKLGGRHIRGVGVAFMLCLMVGCLAPGSETAWEINCTPTFHAPVDAPEQDFCGNVGVVCPLIQDGNRWEVVVVGQPSYVLPMVDYSCGCEAVPESGC